jgi:CheY-like chemotaxis protein
VTEILIADDEPAMLRTLQLVLEQRGFSVQTAGTGRQALQALCRQSAEGGSFDAIILDIIMPDIDGWQVLQALQNNPLWKGIPVVVVSGFANGAQDYAHVMRHNGVLVEKKENFTEVVGAVLDRLLAAKDNGTLK